MEVEARNDRLVEKWTEDLLLCINPTWRNHWLWSHVPSKDEVIYLNNWYTGRRYGIDPDLASDPNFNFIHWFVSQSGGKLITQQPSGLEQLAEAVCMKSKGDDRPTSEFRFTIPNGVLDIWDENLIDTDCGDVSDFSLDGNLSFICRHIPDYKTPLDDLGLGNYPRNKGGFYEISIIRMPACGTRPDVLGDNDDPSEEMPDLISCSDSESDNDEEEADQDPVITQQGCRNGSQGDSDPPAEGGSGAACLVNSAMDDNPKELGLFAVKPSNNPRNPGLDINALARKAARRKQPDRLCPKQLLVIVHINDKPC